MDEMTTGSDSIPDTHTVDIGYHYTIASYTPTPTMTPTPVLTPTPTITPHECTDLGCEVDIPLSIFAPGDIFYCDVLICNPTETSFQNVPLYSVLDVYGVLVILPPLIVDATPGLSRHSVISAFFWPENAGEGYAIMYSAMTNETVTELLGSLGYFQFCWTEH